MVPPNQDVTASAGNTEFYVTVNTDWTAASDASWCIVTPSGINNDTIFATYEENGTGNVRIANITVSGTGVSPQGGHRNPGFLSR
ncbi:MAG: BACON domain-containing protein [bacterium]